jgi:hypothetical protein
MPVVLGLALSVRLAVALACPNFLAPDEVFQYLEQAHRLVYGAGIVPWEYQVGLRSWAIPLLLAGPMALARLCAASPAGGLLLIRILLCFASLPIVWCGVKWGERFYGQRGAWTAGLVTAFWPDLWLMAPHPLEEAISTDLLLPAIYLVEASRGRTDLRHVAWAGFLLGAVFALREQLGPAVAIAGIFLCGRTLRRWRLALSMAAIPVLCAGLLDWYTWGQPFRSFWLNIYLNIDLGVASRYFDHAPPSYYPLNLLYDWLWSALFCAWFAWQGRKKLPVAGLAALATIAVHCVIAHKELRYIFPGVALLVPLAGVGLAEVCCHKNRLQRVVLAAGLMSGPYFSPLFLQMLRWQDNADALYTSLAATHPCVVTIEHWDRGFWPIPPVFGGGTQFTGPSGVAQADAIVATIGTPVPPGFILYSCRAESWIPFHARQPEVCSWTRRSNVCAKTAVAPFVLVYPPAAKNFIIRDRLTDP